jgi:hypothetical protein
MNSQPVSSASLKPVFWYMVTGVIAVAVWCHFIDPVINREGLKYVLAGEAMVRGPFQAGLQAYKWPAYSVSIALVSYVSQLSVESSALVFNVVMRIAAGLAFLNLVRKFGADQRQLRLAALIFVLYPGLNEVQSMIIRDFAYLACFMWMIVFFVQQISNPTRRNLLGFVFMGLLATAYRIEGFVYLVGLFIVYLLWGTVSLPWKKTGLILVLLILPLMSYGVLFWIYNGDVSNAWNQLSLTFAQSSENLDLYITSLDNKTWSMLVDKLSLPILLLMPVVILLGNLIEVVSMGYVLILVGGWICRPLIDKRQTSNLLMIDAWKWIIGINLLVLIGFVLVRQIVTDRYPLSLALMLMLFAPFALTAIWDRVSSWSSSYRRWFIGIAFFLIFVNTLEGLDRFSSKGHMKEAGIWISEQTGGYHKNRVYSNVPIVDYYSGKPVVEPDEHYRAYVVNSLVLTTRWNLLHFMAISLDDDARPGFYRNFRYRIGKEPERIFENHKGDKVLVYDFRDEKDKKYRY